MKETVLAQSLRMMFVLGAVAVVAQAASAQEGEKMQRVEVTGSSVKRADSETALPVQMISKQDIQRIGATSTESLLASIASLSSAGATSNAAGASSGTSGLSSISLRGLGADRTLVLVNGRRLAAFAGAGGATVNVNVIPLAAIERIEILKDGASGVYGSDAVAGVVNFILSKSFEGVDVSAGAGSPTTDGGAQNQKASIVGGFGKLDPDGYSAVLSASWEKEKALFGRDRDYAKSGNNMPYYVSGATGQGNIEGVVIPGAYPNDRGAGFGASPATGYGNPMAASGKCADIQMFQNPTPSTKGAPYCAYDSASDTNLIPARELANVTGNVTFKINDEHQLFADVLLSRSVVTQTIQTSPVRRSFLVVDSAFTQQKVDPSLILYPSNPVYQSIVVPYLTRQGFTSIIGQPLAITSRVFDFGPRQSRDVATQSRFVGGARGTVWGQDYEVAFTSNRSKVSGSLPSGYFLQVEYAKIINDPANNWNPWAPGGVQTGALADKLKAAQYTGKTIDGWSQSDLADSKIAGDLFTIDGRAVQYAAGLQARHESYKTAPSAALLSGDIGGAGGASAPVDRSRTIRSAFGEINAPLPGGVEANLALRNDHYNDVGGTTNYKASLRWQPVRSLLLRASTGSGFRAPTLTDLWRPQVLGTTVAFSDPKTGQSSLQVNGLTGGNPNLKPEESRQASVGVVWSPASWLNAGVDLFRIKVSDILAAPSAQEVVSRFRAGDPAYANLVLLNGNDIDLVKTVLANTGNATVQGADVFITGRHNFGVGRVDAALNGTYMDKFDQMSPGGVMSHKVGTLVDSKGTAVIGADAGGVVLRWKHTLSATWTQGAWASTLIQNYRARYEAAHDLLGNRVFMGAEATYDANLVWRGLKNTTLTLGVRNLFDRQPQTFVPIAAQFQYGYDVSTYDPRGRFVYVNASYAFR
ncbi:MULTISPECIES: TonB-dependent receptor [unclassified Duganella]|uniref:TonB-dependent receptor n=1 Tax=unclassified Duganella TaxID=2636909 RepID=UPI00088CD5BD|nr:MULTISPECIES: TonB-dependent receptor [unclassified Duganella]SDH14923.1 iron complex outermembrane recepter protein [Duganella sp. OV458]SDK29450.1 iron complex outermembrane recepter protein [Duganella sp. OV510]